MKHRAATGMSGSAGATEYPVAVRVNRTAQDWALAALSNAAHDRTTATTTRIQHTSHHPSRPTPRQASSVTAGQRAALVDDPDSRVHGAELRGDAIRLAV